MSCKKCKNVSFIKRSAYKPPEVQIVYKDPPRHLGQPIKYLDGNGMVNKAVLKLIMFLDDRCKGLKIQWC